MRTSDILTKPLDSKIPSPDASPAHCKVCAGVSELFGELQVLRKHGVRYFRCVECGFMQTEEPFWLEEAYSSAIAKQDVGVMLRNLMNRQLTTALLNVLYPGVRRCVDFGGGHGIFVRLMRDRGFDFSLADLYATNDYARGFEYERGQKYDFLTAFEVLEHLQDPIADLTAMMTLSENVFVSTLLVPQPAPKLPDWWYYLPSTGQHVAFYTPKSLQAVARRFGRHLLSNGTHHLFTTAAKNDLLFRLAMDGRMSRVLNEFRKRPSLVEPDFQLMTK